MIDKKIIEKYQSLLNYKIVHFEVSKDLHPTFTLIEAGTGEIKKVRFIKDNLMIAKYGEEFTT